MKRKYIHYGGGKIFILEDDPNREFDCDLWIAFTKELENEVGRFRVQMFKKLEDSGINPCADELDDLWLTIIQGSFQEVLRRIREKECAITCDWKYEIVGVTVPRNGDYEYYLTSIE